MTDPDIIIAAADLLGLPSDWRSMNRHNFNPLTSTDAAMRLVEVMRKDGWRITCNNGLDGTWECELYRTANDDTKDEDLAIIKGFTEAMELHYIPANSLPRAITLACLKAAGKL